MTTLTGAEPYRLPPLILHPFSAADDASTLVESSRAHLTLSGILPIPPDAQAALDQTLVRGRYAELKMLYYIGKDVLRWMDQCTESVSLSDRFVGRRMRPETFALFLVKYIPMHVRHKLECWGVLDFSALFRRSVALHSVFATLPLPEQLTQDFMRKYHRFLDGWFEYRLRECAFDRSEPGEFTFDLYASAEYTTMLEKSWSGGPEAN